MSPDAIAQLLQTWGYPLWIDTLKGLGRRGGDILTTATFTDFEFAWEWRLAFQGKSGVKDFVNEQRATATGAIGHEYQMIDDDNDALEPRRR